MGRYRRAIAARIRHALHGPTTTAIMTCPICEMSYRAVPQDTGPAAIQVCYDCAMEQAGLGVWVAFAAANGTVSSAVINRAQYERRQNGSDQ